MCVCCSVSCVCLCVCCKSALHQIRASTAGAHSVAASPSQRASSQVLWLTRDAAGQAGLRWEAAEATRGSVAAAVDACLLCRRQLGYACIRACVRRGWGAKQCRAAAGICLPMVMCARHRLFEYHHACWSWRLFPSDGLRPTEPNLMNCLCAPW